MTVQDFMLVSGAPMHLTGYEMLKEAIEIEIEGPVKPIMAVYEVVAKTHNTTAYSVERNIRTAIQKGYSNLDADIKKKLFRNAEKVATGNYIKTISYAIRNNLI